MKDSIICFTSATILHAAARCGCVCTLYYITNYAIIFQILQGHLSPNEEEMLWKVIYGHFVNHFVNKNDRAAIFNTKMFDGSHLFFKTIDFKWREMHYEVISVHP